MSRPISPELVLSPDFWISNTPRYFSFASCSTLPVLSHFWTCICSYVGTIFSFLLLISLAFSNSDVNNFWSIKNSSEVIDKLRQRNFQASQISSFEFSTLYTSLPHDLIKEVLSLVNWCFNRESKTYLCTSVKKGCFSNKKYDK